MLTVKFRTPAAGGPCHRAIVGPIRETTCFRRMSDRVIPSVIVIVAFVESMTLVFSLERDTLLS